MLDTVAKGFFHVLAANRALHRSEQDLDHAIALSARVRLVEICTRRSRPRGTGGNLLAERQRAHLI